MIMIFRMWYNNHKTNYFKPLGGYTPKYIELRQLLRVVQLFANNTNLINSSVIFFMSRRECIILLKNSCLTTFLYSGGYAFYISRALTSRGETHSQVIKSTSCVCFSSKNCANFLRQYI